MNVKKKGVLKYFSQIFEEEDEKEIQIGLPTDVKHVAHIGWDGPSATPPSWMDEFRSQNGGYQSAPLDGCANAQNSREDEDLDKDHATDGRERELPGLRRLPKTSRRHVSMDSISLMSSESPVGSPTSHRVLKHKDKDSKNSGGGRRRKEKTSRADDAPNIPNKSRKKKKKKTKTKDKDLDAAPSKPSGKRGKRRGSLQESEDGATTTSTSGLAALEDE